MSGQEEASATSSSASMSRRVRFARGLFRVLLYVWGTLIAGVAIATFANINTVTTDTPLSKLFIIHLTLTYPIPLFSSLSFLLALTLLCWLSSRSQQAPLDYTLSAQHRVHMLRRLRLRYEQMLAQSLQGAVQVELGLASRPAAVQNAASLSLRLPDQPELLLPPHTSIAHAYELAQQELLILGEPGAGKSTLLLELAHYLVEQAEQDVSLPLPVLVPLSSWATARRPLQDWLGEQLALLYDVHRELSQHWIAAGQVQPLLDGLDEMEDSARPACIAAINTYHRNHLQPLVVCSRTDEYETASASQRLALHGAVVVQPLSHEEVDAHLERLGKPLVGLRGALSKNPALRDLANTPLMLQILMLSYCGTSVRELSRKGAELREQIWQEYVQHMVSRKGDAGRYPLHITNAWLSWLAREMRSRNQTIFSLADFQPDWLPARRRTILQLSVGLIGGLFCGSVFGLGVGLTGWLAQRLTGWLWAGLLFGLFIGLFSCGLIGGVDYKIDPTEELVWSWRKLRTGLVVGLLAGLIVALGMGLTFIVFGGLSGGLIGVLGIALFYGSFVGLPVGLGFGLFSGLSRKQLTERVTFSPNEGIRRSVKNALIAGLCVGLSVGLSVGLVAAVAAVLGRGLATGLTAGLGIRLGFSVFFGSLVGLSVGLVRGLGAVMQYYMLRFWFWSAHTFPLKAVPFLEDATTRILMRRIGGGYSFTHRLLLDYFADLHTHASSASTAVPHSP